MADLAGVLIGGTVIGSVAAIVLYSARRHWNQAYEDDRRRTDAASRGVHGSGRSEQYPDRTGDDFDPDNPHDRSDE